MSQAKPIAESTANPRGGWALFVLLLAGLGVAFARVHQVHKLHVEVLPLVVDGPAKLDFGERWEGQTFTWTVPIRNTVPWPLRIEKFETTCQCASVEPKQLELGGGQTAEVRLEIVPVANRRTHRAGSTQVVSLVGYGADRQTVLLSAHVRGRTNRLFDLEAGEVAVPGPVVRGRRSAPARMHVTPRAQAKAVRIETDPDVQADVRLGASGYEVTVWVEPKEAGRWSRTVRMVCESQDSRVIGRCPIPITAEVVEPVVAVPAAFHFGVVPVGEVCEERVALTPLTEGPFVVEGWSTSGPLEVVREGERFYRLRLTARPGDQSARASFTVRGTGGDRFQVDATLSAYGRP